MEPSENTYAQDLSELILAYAAVHWENVLSYSNLPVLSRILEDIEFPISLSQSTEWKVERNPGFYGLSPVKRNSGLGLKLEEFITTYVQYMVSLNARRIARYMELQDRDPEVRSIISSIERGVSFSI